MTRRTGNNYSGPRRLFSRRREPRAHWRCPDCGQPCICTDRLVQLSPHRRCGLRPETDANGT